MQRGNRPWMRKIKERIKEMDDLEVIVKVVLTGNNYYRGGTEVD